MGEADGLFGDGVSVRRTVGISRGGVFVRGFVFSWPSLGEADGLFGDGVSVRRAVGIPRGGVLVRGFFF